MRRTRHRAVRDGENGGTRSHQGTPDPEIASAKSTPRGLIIVCLGHVLQLRAIEKDLTEMHVPENLVKDIVHVVRYGGLGAALSYVSRDRAR